MSRLSTRTVWFVVIILTLFQAELFAVNPLKLQLTGQVPAVGQPLVMTATPHTGSATYVWEVNLDGVALPATDYTTLNNTVTVKVTANGTYEFLAKQTDSGKTTFAVNAVAIGGAAPAAPSATEFETYLLTEWQKDQFGANGLNLLGNTSDPLLLGKIMGAYLDVLREFESNPSQEGAILKTTADVRRKKAYPASVIVVAQGPPVNPIEQRWEQFFTKIETEYFTTRKHDPNKLEDVKAFLQSQIKAFAPAAQKSREQVFEELAQQIARSTNTTAQRTTGTSSDPTNKRRTRRVGGVFNCVDVFLFGY